MLTSDAVRHDGDDQPPNDLEEIIGARDEVEAIAVRDGASLGSSGPQVTQNEVNAEIRHLCVLLRMSKQFGGMNRMYVPSRCRRRR